MEHPSDIQKVQKPGTMNKAPRLPERPSTIPDMFLTIRKRKSWNRGESHGALT